MRRGLVLLLFLLVPGASTPAAAAAKPPLESLGAVHRAADASVDVAFYEPVAGRLRVLDDRAGTVRDLTIGGCTTTSLRPPEALLSCPDPVVLDVATGARQAFPASADPDPFTARSGFVPAKDAFTSAGRVWLAGSFPDPEGGSHDHPCCVNVVLHRSTGERRIVAGLRDLDREDLPLVALTPACDRPRFGGPRRRWLVFDDCRGRTRLLSRCRPSCEDAVSAGGRVAFLARRRLVVVRPASGRRRSWRVPALTPSASTFRRLAMTRRRVLLTLPPGARSGTPGRRLLQVRFG